MNNTTANKLYDNIRNKSIKEIDISVLCDYYGMKNSNDHKNFIISINIITGIYSDIIKFFGKDSIYLLRTCFN